MTAGKKCHALRSGKANSQSKGPGNEEVVHLLEEGLLSRTALSGIAEPQWVHEGQKPLLEVKMMHVTLPTVHRISSSPALRGSERAHVPPTAEEETPCQLSSSREAGGLNLFKGPKTQKLNTDPHEMDLLSISTPQISPPSCELTGSVHTRVKTGG